MSKVLTGGPLHGTISEESLGIQFYRMLKDNCQNESPALYDVETNKSLSYGDFFVMTCKLGEWMRRQNLEQDDIILMCCDNVLEYFIPVIAALYSNIIVANSNSTSSKGELEHVINLTAPKLIICTNENRETFAKITTNINIIIIDEIYQLIEGISMDPFGFAPKICDVYDQVGCILLSSGTTGLSKAVMLTHRNYNARFNQIQDPRLVPTTGESVIIFIPFFHTFGFLEFLTHFYLKKPAYFMRKFDLETVLVSIDKYNISMLPVVPPVLIMLLKHLESLEMSKYDLSSVKNIFCGGAPLSAETEALIRTIYPDAVLAQAYGLTEATFGAIYYLVKDLNTKPGSSGTVIPGTQVIVRDPQSGALLGPREVGEFCYKAETVMKGYLGNSEATRQTFTDDGFLRTGDMCYYDEDRYFYIVDRLKELIKYKGYQIAPAELEAVLMKHPKILDAAVIGKPHEIGGEVPCAFVVKKDEEVTEEELIEYVRDKVAPVKALRGGVRFVESIAKSMSGKVLRKELRKLVECEAK